MSKSAPKPIHSAIVFINISGAWFSREVDSPVMAYACATKYIDGVLDHPGKQDEDRVVIKEKIMRACLDVFDGKLEEFAKYGVEIRSKAEEGDRV